MAGHGRAMGVLVVGAGFLGAQRAAAAVAARGTRLVAVVDRDAAVARAVAGRRGAVALGDLDEALERPDVDLVVVATPHADHEDQVRRALEAGKHVLCEKPLAIDAEAARGLAALADARGLRLATGLNHRFYPPVADALRLVSAWAIGRVVGVRAEIGHLASADFLAGWHADPARSGGGTLMDNGPHACDLVRRFLGEVVAAEGNLRTGPGLPEGIETEASARLHGHDGAIGEVHSSWTRRRGYLSLEIRGTDGELRVETAPWGLSGVLADGRRVSRTYPLDRAVERAYRYRHGCERSLVRELESVVGRAAGVVRPHASGWDGWRATAMVRAVYESARTGVEVALEAPAGRSWHGVRPGMLTRGAR